MTRLLLLVGLLLVAVGVVLLLLLEGLLRVGSGRGLSRGGDAAAESCRTRGVTLTASLAVGGFCSSEDICESLGVIAERAATRLAFGEGLEGVATRAAERELSRHALVLELAVGEGEGKLG